MLTLATNLFLLFTANTLFGEEMGKFIVVWSGPVILVCFWFDVSFDQAKYVYEIRHRLHQGKCKLELKEHIKGVEFAFGSVFSYTHFLIRLGMLGFRLVLRQSVLVLEPFQFCIGKVYLKSNEYSEAVGIVKRLYHRSRNTRILRKSILMKVWDGVIWRTENKFFEWFTGYFCRNFEKKKSLAVEVGTYVIYFVFIRGIYSLRTIVYLVSNWYLKFSKIYAEN